MPEAQRLHNAGNGSQLLHHNLWGDKILSANTYLNLFTDSSNTNVFHYYDQQLNWEILNSLTVPVIAFTGTNDDGILPVIDPRKAMEILKNQLIAAPRVETIVLDGAAHSFDGYEQRIVIKVVNFIIQG